MALGADDVEAAWQIFLQAGFRVGLLAGIQHLLAVLGDLGAQCLDGGLALRARFEMRELLLNAHVEVAAEFDVGATAGHVGRNGDGAGHAGLGHDVGFLLVEAGIQHREALGHPVLAGGLVDVGQRVRVRVVEQGVAVLDQQFADQLGLLDRARSDQDRLVALVGPVDLLDDRVVLLLNGPVDLIVLVDALDRLVGWDLDDLELVDLGELVRLGRGRAGHAGELLVEAEVVLKGDRGERLVLGLDRDLFLGLKRLVQALGVAPALHHTAGELVDDHHLVILDNVVLVQREQSVRAQRLRDVSDDRDVVRVVEVTLFEDASVAQGLLHKFVARLGERDGALLLVEVVMLGHEMRHQRIDRHVQLGAVVNGAGDDQRRARLVDQDRVDLVDDREVVPSLCHRREFVLHVVA
ncbi:hypothetical protein MMMDOFMJ_4607 [Methylobacterium gnaphalii]|nr:hypothetical protein MMMDOFMJ_4607 [Methylobacterium gnaphalii]